MLNNFTKIGLFVGAVFAADYVAKFIWRGFSAHHADNPVVQGISSVTQ